MTKIKTMTSEDINWMLETAVWSNNLRVTKKALKLGADQNAKQVGPPLLSIACFYGYSEVADVLVKAGSELNILDNSGWTPLMYAADNGKMDVMNILIEAGADIEIRNHLGRTALDILKDKHPNQYIIWVNRASLAAVLIREDSAAAGDISREPDFTL